MKMEDTPSSSKENEKMNKENMSNVNNDDIMLDPFISSLLFSKKSPASSFAAPSPSSLTLSTEKKQQQ